MIEIVKISILDWIWHCLKTKRPYLGWTQGDKAIVYQLKIPLIGIWLAERTLVHEEIHLKLNENGYSQRDHDFYDKITWHGLLQFRWGEFDKHYSRKKR